MHEKGTAPMSAGATNPVQTVLIIDDDPTNLAVLSDQLEQCGLGVAIARDGAEGLERAKRARPDLILLDIVMPGMNGIETCRRLKSDESTREIPVIFKTSLSETPDKVAGFEAGGVDYITTPFQVEEVLARVRTHLELSRLRVELEKRVEERTTELRLASELLRLELAERRRSEDVLRKSEKRFAKIFQANPAAIAITRISDGRFVDVNDSLVRLLGYARDELIGRGTLELGIWIDPEDRGRVVELLKTGESVHDREVLLRAKDGQVLTTRYTAELVELEDEPCMLSLVSDITGRKEAEEEHARLEVRFLQAQKLESVGRLAGGVAHDFNNLLTVISGYSDMLLRSLAGDEAKRAQVEQIREAGERAAALTQQLLAFSRKQIIQPRPLDLNGVIADTEKMLRRLIGEDIELLTVLEPSLGTVMADPGQIDQILLNLAVNARDAMPAGGQLLIETANVGPDPTYQARHADATSGPAVLLAVSDTGTGMDEETQRHLFEPFFTTKEKGHGTGLGLATVYGIVKQSGGWISVYSERSKGTTFKIYLPQIAAMGEKTERREVPASGLHGTETVLVVEDQEEVRALAVAALRAYGYRPLQAANGAETLALLKQDDTPIDVMVTDVVLPGMTGKELASLAAGLRPGMKVIYTSGYTENVIVNRGVLAEGVEFLPKPYTPAALVAHIRRVLG
jgi:PAS domain S-box-containing protein